jgi:[protein-PII] uridylyltransferase
VESAARLRAAEAEVRLTLEREPAEAVARFLDRMPRQYLLAVPAEQVARHYAMLAAPLGGMEVRTLTSLGERPGTYRVAVGSRDRRGLLSKVAGSFALSGLSILTAQVFTTEDGLALDLFEVEGKFEKDVGEERWRGFRATLRKALEERLSLEHGVREKRSHYPPPREDIPVKVDVDNEASDFFSVVEVSAPDRIGLLFDVTRTLSSLGLDVHLAKVATMGARVVDAFYVRDHLGRKLEHPAEIGRLTKAIEAALA